MCNMKDHKNSVESNNNESQSQQPSFSSSIVHPRHKRNRFVLLLIAFDFLSCFVRMYVLVKYVQQIILYFDIEIALQLTFIH